MVFILKILKYKKEHVPYVREDKTGVFSLVNQLKYLIKPDGPDAFQQKGVKGRLTA